MAFFCLYFGYVSIFEAVMRRVKPLEFPCSPLVVEARNLASFIRAARTQSGLTLEDAALATGIAKSTMQSIETDPSKVAFDTVLRVARALGPVLN